MKKGKKLEILEEAVKAKGYKLRYEKGNFIGGDCRLKEDNIIVVNRFLPVEGKIYTIAGALHKLKTDEYPPKVGKIIEESGFTADNQLPLIREE